MIYTGLILIIIVLLIKSYLDDVRHGHERDRLMKGIMAKNLQEYDQSVTIKEPDEPTPPKDIALEDADQSLFEKHLKNIVQHGEQSEDGEHTQS